MRIYRPVLAFSLILALMNPLTVSAEENKECEKVDSIIEEMDYSLYNNENKNLQFMNDFLDKIGANSNYNSIDEFIDYSRDNYQQIVPYTVYNTYKNYNYTEVKECTDVVVLVHNDEFYVVHHNDDIDNHLLYVSFVNNDSSYKNILVNYDELAESQTYIYKITINQHKPLDEVIECSPYGNRSDPFTGETRYHSGVDLSANQGDLIYATEKGICHTFYNDSYGNYVKIEHENGISTLYAHCSELLISDGQEVNSGQIIAKVGATGRATGPHLHFEYRINDEPNSPYDYLDECK